MIHRLRMLVLAQLGAACGTAPSAADDSEPAEADSATSFDPDRDGDGVPGSEDCNDRSEWVHPGADETCNGRDDDCDGEVDEDAVDRVSMWPDADGDGWGEEIDAQLHCPGAEGFVEQAGDCDDTDADLNPDATDVCNDRDDDCDGEVDVVDWHDDADGDGYGADATSLRGSSCEDPPEGVFASGGDCDDQDPAVNPGAEDVCGGPTDEDCDGRSAHCLWLDWTRGEEACWMRVETDEKLYGDAISLDDYAPYGSFGFWVDFDTEGAFGGTQACRVGVFPDTSMEIEVEGSWLVVTLESWLSGNLEGPIVWRGTTFGFSFGAWDADMDDGGEPWLATGGLELDISNIDASFPGGRPFTVATRPRLATATSAAWAPRAQLDADALPGPLRARIAATWARLGRFEHASVASFARFSLELTALGAPADLLVEATRAMADEVRHAQACFGVADALGAPAPGVGPLDVSGSLDDVSAAAVLDRLITEGCVGETLSAAEAGAALEGARAPAVRDALVEIVADEARHAAYAWRCARWLLETHPELQPVAVAAFARAEPSHALPDTDPAAPTLAAWGLLDARGRARSTTAAWRAVVVPARDALLGAALAARDVRA